MNPVDTQGIFTDNHIKSMNLIRIPSQRLSKKGMSLVELMFAAGILAFALCGIVSLFVNCSKLNEANRNLSIAASHAQFIMETIKYTPFANIKTNIDDEVWNWTTTQINANGLIALRSEAIETSAIGTRPLQVTVTSTWQDRTGRNRTFFITTLFQ